MTARDDLKIELGGGIDLRLRIGCTVRGSVMRRIRGCMGNATIRWGTGTTTLWRSAFRGTWIPLPE